MARSGLSKSEVKKARDFLVSQGRHPSVDAIRVALGNTGSKTTIHKYVKELEKEAGSANDRQLETARTLQELIEELAAKLHADTETRIAAMQAEHELALQRKTEEMAALQKRIEILSARLQELEAAARNVNPAQSLDAEDARQTSARQFGAGFFGALLNTSRNGNQDQSLFSALLNSSRSAIIVPREIQPAFS
jgi:hypothetical protein